MFSELARIPSWRHVWNALCYFSKHTSSGCLYVQRSTLECIKQMAWQIFLWVCKELLYQWPAWLISHYVGSSRTSPGSEGGECDDLWFRYYRVSPGSIWRKRFGVRRQTIQRQELDTHTHCSSFLLGLTSTAGTRSYEGECQLWAWKRPSFTTKSHAFE